MSTKKSGRPPLAWHLLVPAFVVAIAGFLLFSWGIPEAGWHLTSGISSWIRPIFLGVLAYWLGERWFQEDVSVVTRWAGLLVLVAFPAVVAQVLNFQGIFFEVTWLVFFLSRYAPKPKRSLREPLAMLALVPVFALVGSGIHRGAWVLPLFFAALSWGVPRLSLKVAPGFLVLLALPCGVLSAGIRRDVAMDRVVAQAAWTFQAARPPGDRVFRSVAWDRWPSGRFSFPLGDKATLEAALHDGKGGRVFLIAKDVSLDASVIYWGPLASCPQTWLDRIWPCDPNRGAVVLMYVGEPVEMNQARILEGQGKFAEARAILERYRASIQGGPLANQGVTFYAGLLAGKAGDLAAMDRLYAMISPHQQGSVQFLYNWGLLKIARSRIDEAVAVLEGAASLAPSDVSVQLTLGEGYFRQGRRAKALSVAKKMKRLYPDNESAKRKLAEWEK